MFKVGDKVVVIKLPMSTIPSTDPRQIGAVLTIKRINHDTKTNMFWELIFLEDCGLDKHMVRKVTKLDRIL